MRSQTSLFCIFFFRILLSGKMAVKCDEIFLHYVSQFEFVDSVEWRRRRRRKQRQTSHCEPMTTMTPPSADLAQMMSMNVGSGKDRYQVIAITHTHIVVLYMLCLIVLIELDFSFEIESVLFRKSGTNV